MSEDRRQEGNRRAHREGGRRSTDEFLTPGDLCRRWCVDPKTLNKFPIPWVHLSPTVRRIDRAFVVTYEESNRLTHSSS